MCRVAANCKQSDGYISPDRVRGGGLPQRPAATICDYKKFQTSWCQNIFIGSLHGPLLHRTHKYPPHSQDPSPRWSGRTICTNRTFTDRRCYLGRKVSVLHQHDEENVDESSHSRGNLWSFRRPVHRPTAIGITMDTATRLRSLSTRGAYYGYPAPSYIHTPWPIYAAVSIHAAPVVSASPSGYAPGYWGLGYWGGYGYGYGRR